MVRAITALRLAHTSIVRQIEPARPLLHSLRRFVVHQQAGASIAPPPRLLSPEADSGQDPTEEARRDALRPREVGRRPCLVLGEPERVPVADQVKLDSRRPAGPDAFPRQEAADLLLGGLAVRRLRYRHGDAQQL